MKHSPAAARLAGVALGVLLPIAAPREQSRGVRAADAVLAVHQQRLALLFQCGRRHGDQIHGEEHGARNVAETLVLAGAADIQDPHGAVQHEPKGRLGIDVAEYRVGPRLHAGPPYQSRAGGVMQLAVSERNGGSLQHVDGGIHACELSRMAAGAEPGGTSSEGGRRVSHAAREQILEVGA